MAGFRLRGEVPKEFLAAGDGAVAVAVQHQECIVVSSLGPGYSNRMAIAANVEHNSIPSRRQMKAFPFRVNDNRAGRAADGRESLWAILWANHSRVAVGAGIRVATIATTT